MEGVGGGGSCSLLTAKGEFEGKRGDEMTISPSSPHATPFLALLSLIWLDFSQLIFEGIYQFVLFNVLFQAYVGLFQEKPIDPSISAAGEDEAQGLNRS